MISGHANIQSAVAATKLGAADFIQKPFSVSGLLASIARALDDGQPAAQVSSVPAQESAGVANRKQPRALRAARPQRTIARSIVMGGQGLHTGLKTGVILHPAPTGSGIVFSSLADETAVAACLENVSDTGYNTTLTSGGRSVRTVEHLMSALHAFGITNLLIKTDDEVPALDGSALEFCRQLTEAGVTDQDRTVEPIRITKPIVIGEEGEGCEFIRIEPADVLTIDYTLDYPEPVGIQRVHFELSSPESYTREIAPARTFTFVKRVPQALRDGTGSGRAPGQSDPGRRGQGGEHHAALSRRICAPQGARSDRRPLPVWTADRRACHRVEDRTLGQPGDGEGDPRLARSIGRTAHHPNRARYGTVARDRRVTPSKWTSTAK